jgi:nucleoside-diphosphate-sugar epimerase
VKIVVTGAAGVLGREVVTQLREAGERDLRLVDLAPLPSDEAGEALQADLSVADQAQAAVRGAEVVIHCAAVHPWKPYTADQYLDLNVKGTHHLLQACVASGVPRVIYTSSIAAVGYARALDELPLTEHVDRRPDELYGMTKLMGELLCEMFSRSHGLRVIMLRPPGFSPRSGDVFGAALLGNVAHVSDVARAHVLALQRPDILCDAFYCTNPLPYTREDAEALRTDPRSVYCRYFPEARDFILSREGTATPLGVYYDLARARRELGYEPQVGFATWFAAREAES